MKIKSPYLVKPGSQVRLDHHSTNSTGKIASHEAGNAVLVGHREQLAKLQEVFWASQTKSLLIVLQGLDTAGKDGTISHIFQE
jgi:polyphosphate kinase 2 (PPK2 family)